MKLRKRPRPETSPLGPNAAASRADTPVQKAYATAGDTCTRKYLFKEETPATVMSKGMQVGCR